MASVASADGTRIAYTATGTGPTLVYVSGATMHRAIDEWGRGIAAALSSQHTVITYDRRGRGESGDTPPYAVEREVDDITALITHVGTAAAVFGESSGAVLALEAVLRGAPITKLALYEPPFIVDDGKEPIPAGLPDQLDTLIAEGRRDDVLELFMTVGAGLPPEAVDEARTSPMWPVLESVAHTISYDGRIMGDTQAGDPASLKRFEPVTIPVLAMAGGESPTYQRNAVAELSAVLPDAQVVIVDGQSHQFDPLAVAPLVARFAA